MNNPVVHFEILGSDGAALIEFYREVFGWPLRDTPLPGWPSYAIMEPEQGMGGAVGRADAAPDGAVIVYIEVDDVGGALDRAVERGATVALPVTSVAGTQLSVAWLRDPQGNLVGLVKRSG
jgi:predicted enzyme related to lactoylglutathione lyase